MFAKYGPWVAWGLVLWGVLQIGDLPLSATHSICGPWGCGPPLPALIACHGAWLVILAPIAYLIPIRLSSFLSRIVGWSIMMIGMLGVLGVGLYESMTWLPAVDDSLQHYFVRRWAFSVITLTDVPMLQTIGLGGMFILLGREQVTPEELERDVS